MNPYSEGYDDGYEDHWNNPYKRGTLDYDDYEEGFDDGQAALNKWLDEANS